MTTSEGSKGKDLKADSTETPKSMTSGNEENGDESYDRRTDILKAARAMLIQNGYPAFSMRRFADKIGIHLKTLQHYFATKRDLILETLDYTLDTHYFDQYVTLFNKVGNSSSADAFSTIIKYLIEDCRREETSKFFSEMWALSFRDEGARTALDAFYVRHRQQLEMLIARANPKLSPKTTKLRAAVIACQIEGLVPLIGYDKPDHLGFHVMESEVHDRIMEYVFSK